MAGRTVRADDLGLKKLPKPMIAFVEHDHFVALVRADERGVCYICSDCGAWPGGRVDLTWKQWHALDPGVFVTVSAPGSRADRLLTALLSGKSGEPAPLRLASAAPLSRLHVWGLIDLSSLIALLKGHVFLLPPGTTVICGDKPTTLSCAPSASCPMDPADDPCARYGPSAGDPVNVATREEEYQTAPDLVVYNPHGPGIVWRRIYNSLPGPDPTYQSDDFGIGWSQPYNAEVYDPYGYSMNPLIGGGETEDFLPTSTDMPAGGAAWDVLLNGSTVASSGSPGNWAVTVNFSYPYYYLCVSVPTTAAVAASYEVRYATGSVGSLSGLFDVPAANSIPQGATRFLTLTGTDHPASDPLWDVALNGTVVASSTQPNGWTISGYSVTPALSAAISSGYEVRRASGTFTSAFFTVEASRFHLSTATKYLYLANGSRIPFNPPAVPTASQPQVFCAAGEGQPLRVEWDYDASSVYGHYTLTWADGTKWVTGTPAKVVQTPYVTAPQWWSNPAAYLLTQITDRNGNSLTLQYSGTGSSGFPLLSKILDASTGAALLTINRATDGTGNITSVVDAYGRGVYYQVSAYATQRVPAGWPQSYQELHLVSQIVTTGTPSPPARWTYGYADFGNTEGEGVPYLHTIDVPSPTGSGTSEATITYDSSSGVVTSVADAHGNSRNYSAGVDSSHNLVTLKNSSGVVVYTYTIGFDNSMNETSVTDGTNSTVVVANSYADPSNPHKPTSITIGSSADGSARTTTYTWGSYGRLASVTSPRGTVTNYNWNYNTFPLGRLTSVQEGTRTPTTFAYFEPSGNLQTVNTPAPAGSGVTGTVATSFQYDSLGNVTQVTEPGNNNLDPVTHQPKPIVTAFNYTTDGTYTQPAAVGQALTITDNLGKVTHLRYNPRGALISVVDPLGNPSTVSYNLADQAVEASSPKTGQTGPGCAATISRYLYPGGPEMMVQQYDENGVLVRQATAVYGAEGELLADKLRNDAGTDDTVASYSYDPAMRLISLTDGNNHQTGYSYNQAGYLSAVTYPGADSVQFPMYDMAGRPLQRKDGNSTTTSYVYSDPDGLLSDIQYPPVNGQPNPQNVHLTYDSYDRRATMADGTGSVSYGYDDADNVVSVTTTYTGLPARAISYTYYPNNSRQAMTTPAGTFTYLYDLVSRLTSLTNPSSETSQWGYLDNGTLGTQQLANGVTSFYTYNARTFLTDLQNKTSGGTLLSEFGSQSMASQMLYDAVGNRVQMNVSIPAAPTYGGATAYTVNHKDQLTQEQSTRQLGSPSGYTYGFLYDLAGNPTTFRNAANSFNSDNQNTASGYSYDGNGSPTLYKGSTLAFDLENHLKQIGSSWTAGYTGDGLRAWKQNGSARTYFLSDDTLPVIEMDGSGNVTAVNTFGPNGLASRSSGGASTFYTFDPQGSVCQRLNSAGSVLSTDMYDGYGVEQSTASPSDPWAFGAQWGYRTPVRLRLARRAGHGNPPQEYSDEHPTLQVRSLARAGARGEPAWHSPRPGN